MSMLSRFATTGGGGDPYWSNVSLLLVGNGANGTNTNIVDSSANNTTLTNFGSTLISTTQSKFGSGSVYFNGSSQYLKAGTSSALAFGTGNFTVEFWVYVTGSPNDTGIYDSRASGPGTNETGFTITALTGSVIRIYCNGALIASSGTSYVNQWVYIAVTRSAGTWNLFINGNSVGTSSAVRNLTNTDTIIGGGRYSSDTTVTSFFNGYIYDFRETKGVARYTGSTMTVPTAPLPIG